MSWEQLLDIQELQRDDDQQARDATPEACPNDGQPLREGPDGVLFCLSDGWQYPRDYVRP